MISIDGLKKSRAFETSPEKFMELRDRAKEEKLLKEFKEAKALEEKLDDKYWALKDSGADPKSKEMLIAKTRYRRARALSYVAESKWRKFAQTSHYDRSIATYEAEAEKCAQELRNLKSK